MKSLSIKYPESVLATLNLSTDDFEKEAKLALAVKLFELRRLSIQTYLLIDSLLYTQNRKDFEAIREVTDFKIVFV